MVEVEVGGRWGKVGVVEGGGEGGEVVVGRELVMEVWKEVEDCQMYLKVWLEMCIGCGLVCGPNVDSVMMLICICIWNRFHGDGIYV